MGSQSAVQKFIASARQLHAEEKVPVKRWARMTPLLEELLADPAVKEQTTKWPDCSQGGERAEKAGGFLQGRYDPVNKEYWQGYGPKQLPYALE